MAKDALLLTQDGLEKLKNELTELTGTRRGEVVDALKKAREMGDLSENAAYDNARKEQAFVEGRIKELEEIIENAQVVEGPAAGMVGLGSNVTVHIDGDEESLMIVGEPEADPANSKISHTSPLGQALMGKKVGDEVQVEAPVGEITYTIVKVG